MLDECRPVNRCPRKFTRKNGDLSILWEVTLALLPDWSAAVPNISLALTLVVLWKCECCSGCGGEVVSEFTWLSVGEIVVLETTSNTAVLLQ